jgi:hypothetical protein
MQGMQWLLVVVITIDPFDIYRATAEELIKEYKACESPDYITYVRHLAYQTGL